MKKDKEWLKAQIKDEERELKSVYDNYVPYEKVLIADDINDLIDQLDEQELPVIPQFVADRINEYKDIQFGISLIFMINRQIDEDVEFSKWLSSEKDNCEIVARAWLDGYKIKEEPKYLVILSDREDKEKGQALYKDFNFNGDKVVSTHIESFNKTTALEADNFCFTEQEIKAIDERYWAFAEEVDQ